MLLQVHDELVFEVWSREAEEIQNSVKEKMEGVVRLEVLLIVGIGPGESWFDAKSGREKKE